MSQELPLELLADALDGHSVCFRRESGALVLLDAPMAFRADAQPHSIHPDSVIMQVAFATDAPALGGRTIWSVFAGVGANEDEAVKNGVMKFLLGPFHVLLSALGGHVCARGNEEWRTRSHENGGTWRICDSALTTQGFDDPASVPFAGVQAELERAFAGHSRKGVHWAEVFFAFLNGDRTSVDVQLDGSPWPEGARIVEGWDFKPGDGYKSGRYFFIALRAE